MYLVRQVPVDATAETAEAARTVALARGQADAYTKLMRRITPPEFAAALPAPSPDLLAQLINGVQVFDERRSATRYLANLEVAFRPDAVRRLLRDRGIGFSETVAKPMLVLPVLRRAFTSVLYEDPNPWRAAWQAREDDGALVPVVVPLGDIADQRTVDARTALNGVGEALDRLADRYGAGDVLVVEARLSETDRDRLEVLVDHHGPAGLQSDVRSYSRSGDEDMAAVLARAAADIHTTRIEAWKRRTLLRFEDRGRIVARAPLTGFRDWLTLQERLGRVNVIERVEVRQLAADEVWLTLHHFGDAEQLVVSLSQRDLDLDRTTGIWLLRLAAGTRQ